MTIISRASARTVVLFGALLAVGAPSSRETADPASLTAHEWGTFTSIAGEDGSAVEWMPLAGPQDLPCFVERVRYRPKSTLYGTVRMETPVIYFYSPQATTVNVRVRFHDGLVTEWFPRAAVTPSLIDARQATPRHSTIEWKDVRVVPGGSSTFPTEARASHYYPARVTDAAAVTVGSQHEKFLFYRGVGRFAPPLTAVVSKDGRIAVDNPAGDALGEIILFENRNGRVGYRLMKLSGSQAVLAPPQLGGGDLVSLRKELERVLIARGLFQKEAAAMLETWRDSWFEEGSRLFYIAPRRTVDAILPLDIQPTPTQISRVFVGRMELVTSRTLADVQAAVMSGDRTTFRTYGRFADAIAARIVAGSTMAERPIFQEKLSAAYSAYYAGSPASVGCQ